ncbi:MAG: hypothetical protein IJQ68_00305 [Methanobrevibacter sp.]|uniref:hypothetical protein n=1 Tax=Methanobrevibacter sp. TaxID=66852 RepID=UPI0025E72D51|nr:hypothetical protein [Methanobrevibacter sp.]MBR0270427.1 hypothetical protein [Methanobrevibacter sp.]
MPREKFKQKQFCELTREEQFKADIARKNEIIENRDYMLAKKDKELNKLEVELNMIIAIKTATIILQSIQIVNLKKMIELNGEIKRIDVLLKFQRNLIKRFK